MTVDEIITFVNAFQMKHIGPIYFERRGSKVVKVTENHVCIG
jgi:hypothetical protein